MAEQVQEGTMRIGFDPNVLLHAQGEMWHHQMQFTAATQRIVTGKRVTSAVDDAAGLAIVEGLRARSFGAAQAQRNIQDGVSMLDIADGALSASVDLLQRVRRLAVEAANGTYTLSHRSAFQREIEGYLKELDAITERAKFNQQALLDGSTDEVNVQVGAGVNETVQLRFAATTSRELGLRDTGAASESAATTARPDTQGATSGPEAGGPVGSAGQDAPGALAGGHGKGGKPGSATLTAFAPQGATLSVIDQELARSAIERLDVALSRLLSVRADVGAATVALTHLARLQAVTEANLEAARSRTEDADLPAEHVRRAKAALLLELGSTITTAVLRLQRETMSSLLSPAGTPGGQAASSAALDAALRSGTHGAAPPVSGSASVPAANHPQPQRTWSASGSGSAAAPARTSSDRLAGA